jgi:hypothetical protein
VAASEKRKIGRRNLDNVLVATMATIPAIPVANVRSIKAMLRYMAIWEEKGNDEKSWVR